MKKQKNNNSKFITIHFDVAGHEVKAEAVAAMIKAMATLIKAASKEVDEESQIEVNVDAIDIGSLEIFLSVTQPAGLFIASHIKEIAAAINICKEYFSLRRWLKGNPLPKPQEQESETINIGDITINVKTVNVFNNCHVGKDVSDAFQESEDAKKIKEVSIYEGNTKNKIAIIPREEFGSLKRMPANEQTDIAPHTDIRRTKVTIQKPVFLGNGKWSVLFEERVISVKITDDHFLQKVRGSQQGFYAGDKLDVSLLIQHIFDEDLQEMKIDTSGYEIIKVHKTIHKSVNSTKIKESLPKQQQLFTE